METYKSRIYYSPKVNLPTLKLFAKNRASGGPVFCPRDDFANPINAG